MTNTKNYFMNQSVHQYHIPGKGDFISLDDKELNELVLFDEELINFSCILYRTGEYLPYEEIPSLSGEELHIILEQKNLDKKN